MLGQDMPSTLLEGRRLIDGRDVLELEAQRNSTARITSGFGLGPQLNAAINEIAYATGAGTAVALPPALAGRSVTVLNSTAFDVMVNASQNPLLALPDTISGSPSVLLDAGALVRFMSPHNGLWVLDAGGGGAGVTPSAVPPISTDPVRPANPNNGTLWFNPGTGRVQIFLGGWTNLGNVV